MRHITVGFNLLAAAIIGLVNRLFSSGLSQPLWFRGLSYEVKDDPNAINAATLAEIKAAIKTTGTAWEEFKKTNDANLDRRDVVNEEKLTRINDAMDKSGEALNSLVTKLEAAQKELAATSEEDLKVKAALQGRIDQLEVTLKRAPSGPEDVKEQKHERFEAWGRAAIKSIIHTPAGTSDEEKAVLAAAIQEMKDMTVGSDSSGGFLAPAEYVKDILRGVVEISPFRDVATVRQTSARSLMYPKRTGTGAALWATEIGTRSETDNPTYGMLEIPNHEMSAIIDISEQNLEDSAFNLEQFIQEDSAEQFAVAEGLAMVSGSGVGRPEGILTNADIGETNSGAAATIADSAGTADGLITMFHAQKTAYASNATWLLNRTTLGSVRKLKDANDQYIWMMGLAELRPNTILGAPYVEMPDMPNEAANAYPIAFGDFKRGYLVVDRVAMSILRDPYTQAAGGIIRFLFRRRVGGQVLISEAIRKLKCSV
jgi:HK97 family phage major capsid protein